MRGVNMNPEAPPPCVFYLSDVDGSGLVDGVGFVIVTHWWHAEEIEKHLRGKCDVEVQTCCWARR